MQSVSQSSHASDSKWNIVVLQEGLHPKNLDQWYAFVLWLLETYGPELGHTKFNQVAGKFEGRLRSFRVKEEKRKLKKEDTGKAKTEEGDEDKSGEVVNLVDGDEEGAWSVLCTEPMPQFVDPNTGDAEETKYRSVRVKVWGLLTQSIPHHQYLLHGVVRGNIAGLVRKVCGSSGESSVKVQTGNVIRMTKLSKVGMSFEEFAMTATKLYTDSVSRSARKPDLAIGESVFVELLLMAVAKDHDYATQVQLIRDGLKHEPNGKLTFNGVMQRLSAHAGAIANTKSARHEVEAMMARTNMANGKGGFQSGKECYQYARTGHCEYGDKCRFRHSPGKKKTGVCPDCGSDQHGLQDCPKAELRRLRAAQVRSNKSTSQTSGTASKGAGEGDTGAVAMTAEAMGTCEESKSAGQVDDPMTMWPRPGPRDDEEGALRPAGMWPTKSSLDM